MHIVGPFIAATVIVFFGYVVLWMALRPDTPKSVARFGNVLAIIIFVMAGLALAAGLLCPRFCGMQGGKYGMMPPGCRGGAMMQQGAPDGGRFSGRGGMPCMKGKPGDMMQSGQIPPEDRDPVPQK